MANFVMKRSPWALFALSLVLSMPAFASQSFVFIDRDQFIEQTDATMATEPYLPINNSPKSFTSGSVTFTAQGVSSFLNAEWTTRLPGIDIALNDKEDLDMVLDAPVHAMGFGFEDLDGGTGESTFTVTARLGTRFVDQFIFVASGSDSTTETFVGFWSPQLFDRLEIRELTAVNENEYFGAVYTGLNAPNFISKLKAADTQVGDQFGRTVAIAGDYAAIAAPGADGAGEDSGGVDLYQRAPDANWLRIARLFPQTPEPFDGFANALAMQDTILAAATFSDDDQGGSSGSVTLWERQLNGQWTRQPKLLPGDGELSQFFGYAVATDGQRLLVGAPGDDNLSTGTVINAGAAYLFEKQPNGTWLEVYKFVLDEPVNDAQLGWDVAISGNYAAISARGIVQDTEGFNFPSVGSVYLFERQSDDEWTQIAELTAETFREGFFYGQAVEMYGSRLVVSEVQIFDALPGTGQVTVYARNGAGQWLVESVLRGEDFGANTFFGTSLAIHDDQLLVGAPRTTNALGIVGSAFLYNRTEGSQWQLTRELPGPDSALNDNYGISVALDGASILIGANGDDDLGLTSGSVYLLEADRIVDFYDLLFRDDFELTPAQ